MVSRAAEKMRRQGLATSAVVVMLATNPHNDDPKYYASRHVRLTIATADTARRIRATLGACGGSTAGVPLQENGHPAARPGPGR